MRSTRVPRFAEALWKRCGGCRWAEEAHGLNSTLIYWVGRCEIRLEFTASLYEIKASAGSIIQLKEKHHLADTAHCEPGGDDENHWHRFAPDEEKLSGALHSTLIQQPELRGWPQWEKKSCLTGRKILVISYPKWYIFDYMMSLTVLTNWITNSACSTTQRHNARTLLSPLTWSESQNLLVNCWQDAKKAIRGLSRANEESLRIWQRRFAVGSSDSWVTHPCSVTGWSLSDRCCMLDLQRSQRHPSTTHSREHTVNDYKQKENHWTAVRWHLCSFQQHTSYFINSKFSMCAAVASVFTQQV